MKSANTHAPGLRLARGWILLAAASLLIAQTADGNAAPADRQNTEKAGIAALQAGAFACHLGGLGGYYEMLTNRCGS